MHDNRRRPIIGIPAHVNDESGLKCYATRSSYVAAVQAHGGLPVALPPGNEDIVDSYLDLVDGLLIPGGTDIDPSRYGEAPDTSLLPVDAELDEMELRLIPKAYDRDLPLLAICRGIQSVAVALGGSLIQDLPTQHSGLSHDVRQNGREFLAHKVDVKPESQLARVLGRDEISVNSLHHQAVRVLPDTLMATAWSRDRVLEAVEAPGKSFMIAVQCHPEELWDGSAPEFSRLFAAFVDACRP